MRMHSLHSIWERVSLEVFKSCYSGDSNNSNVLTRLGVNNLSSIWHFENVGHDSAQVELEKTYYTILMLGVIVTLTKTCLSSYFAGIGRTRVVMICDVCGLVFNVPLCYVMVFGKLGLPELGIVGAGISTIIASFFACLLFFLFYF